MKFHIIDNVYLNPKMIEFMCVCEDASETRVTYHLEISVSRKTFAHGEYNTLDEAKAAIDIIAKEMEKLK